MNEQDESRTLVHSQTLARRQRNELDWSGWNDFFVALLDHYCGFLIVYHNLILIQRTIVIIAREEKRPGGIIKYDVTSRVCSLIIIHIFGISKHSHAFSLFPSNSYDLDNLTALPRTGERSQRKVEFLTAYAQTHDPNTLSLYTTKRLN